MTFHVGQKVVFIGGAPMGNNIVDVPGDQLKKGTVYTVRELDPIYIPFFGAPGLRVAEIVHPKVRWRGCMVEPCRTTAQFRPLIERKSSTEAGVEILKQIARDLTERKPVKVGA